MIIKKILNNNVVIARNEDDKEVVVMGLGLGFSKKAGDSFPKDDTMKVFVLSDEYKGQYWQLMRNVDPRSTEIAEKIISYAADEKKLRIKEVIHISLTDHIDGVLSRIGEGINITNQLTMEISRVYQTEFEIGLYALKLLKAATGKELSRDEAAFIALHFVNNEVDRPNDGQDLATVIQFVNDTVKLVETYYKIQINEESMHYYRFVTHLKYLSKRIHENKVYTDDSMLYGTVSASYPEAARCALKIGEVVKLKYHKDVSTEELAYLTIYVEKLSRDCVKAAIE